MKAEDAPVFEIDLGFDVEHGDALLTGDTLPSATTAVPGIHGARGAGERPALDLGANHFDKRAHPQCSPFLPPDARCAVASREHSSHNSTLPTAQLTPD